MVTLARRGTPTLAYNPLADGGGQAEAADTWVCVCDHGANYRTSPYIEAAAVRHCGVGTKVRAVKQGAWLVENGSGLYLPYKDSVTEKRLFVNERVLLMNQLANQGRGKAQRQVSSDSAAGGDLGRLSSGSSLEESGRGGIRMSRQISEDSMRRGSPKLSRQISQSSVGNGTPRVSRQVSQDSVGNGGGKMSRKNSLNSMDSTPSSIELRRTKTQGSLDTHSSFWICVGPGDVPCFTEASLDAEVIGHCLVGTKVHAAKEGEWLKVVDVSKSVDVASTMTRRSFRLSEKVELQDTGLFLPLINPESGARLFKNEKIEIWEQVRASKGKQVPEPGNHATCALM